ncbi:hypothetical protein GCM10020331_020350 [Ectobacillus funiculus]
MAVLQMDEKYAAKVIEIGDSTKVQRGEPAIAIGNPLGLEFFRYGYTRYYFSN